jgi:hypothetical protein
VKTVDGARGIADAAGGEAMGDTRAPSQRSFRRTGSMTTPRDSHAATLLRNGKVLVAGGEYAGKSVLASAELYDPASGTFTATGSMTEARGRLPTATLLADGRVLIVGGFYFHCLSTAEVYDPVAGTFTATGGLTTPRSFHTATLLSGGKVLITGGETDSDASASTYLATAELYDPTTGTFSATGSMSVVRAFHTATLLGDGRVLVTGSDRGDASAEIYDPATESFTRTGSMTTSRNGLTATLLANGKVLVAGGQPQVGTTFLSSAELYDPVTGKFSATANMTTERAGHTATALPSGLVLIIGGTSLKSLAYVPTTAELYDPENAAFAPTSSLVVPRNAYAATLLSEGDVLISGGSDIITGASFDSAEIY